MEIEVPPITDALEPTLRTRLEALIETVKERQAAMIFAGIDAGSRTLKIVLLDAARRDAVAARVVDQGIDQDRLAAELAGPASAGAAACGARSLAAWSPPATAASWSAPPAPP